MAGFREFLTGEVLSAANVNNFLMKQSVMVFDDADARTAALGAETIEGMLTYNKDTDQLEVFDGTNFVVAAPEPPAQNLVAVKSAIFTGIQSVSVNAGNNAAVTDLSITHEVADAANRLIISGFIGLTGNVDTEAAGPTGMAFHDGSGLIAVGNSDGSRRPVTSGFFVRTNTGGDVSFAPSATIVHTPGAGSKTYTLRIVNVATFTRTLNINRHTSDSNSGNRPRAVSSLVISEVKV